MTASMVTLIVQADVHYHGTKVISTASAVLHAPVQVCLSALHLVRKLSEPSLVLISYSTTTYFP